MITRGQDYTGNEINGVCMGEEEEDRGRGMYRQSEGVRVVAADDGGIGGVGLDAFGGHVG